MSDKSLERAALFVTALLAGGLFWLSPRLPMTDLPQLAGQVAIGHDLMLGASKWQSLLYFNYFTPYLLGYAVALVFSFLLPVSIALKLVLTLAYYGFVAACVGLRRHLGGDRRLDWLFVPGYFGFAYLLGFYTFLVAAPLGVLFVLQARRYAQRPALVPGIVLVLAGLAVFLSHGLVFLFTGGIGFLFLALGVERSSRSWAALTARLLPYIVLGVLCLAYLRLGLRLEANTWGDLPAVFWGWNIFRLKYLLMPMGILKADWDSGLLVGLMLCAPVVLGSRLNWHPRSWRGAAALVPFATFAAAYLLLPLHVFAANTTHIYPRLVIFFLPFYALLFRARSGVEAAGQPAHRYLSALWLPLLCWSFLAIQASRSIAFAREQAAFDDVLAATEPGYRALGLILSDESPAFRNFSIYRNFPSWYQAEKQGLVDPNFAHLGPQVVRFRAAERDPFEQIPDTRRIDWERLDSIGYRYYFVRSEHPVPATYFAQGKCAPTLLKASGDWSVYENVHCHAPAGGGARH
ncbi:MAG: hypothetical protein JSR47_04080 [Proteobacteria bacterium]|nr:hypothetical protein [Pseudomonadota bacterium]